MTVWLADVVGWRGVFLATGLDRRELGRAVVVCYRAPATSGQ